MRRVVVVVPRAENRAVLILYVLWPMGEVKFHKVDVSTLARIDNVFEGVWSAPGSSGGEWPRNGVST